MRVLRRYIATTVFSSIIAVLFVILVLNLLVLVVDEIDEIEGQYTLIKALEYACWRIPGFLVTNTGFAALIGCLIGLGILAGNNELTVIRASGVSLIQIVWLVMRPVLVVIVFGMALGEISPHTERVAEVYRNLSIVTAKEVPVSKVNKKTARIFYKNKKRSSEETARNAPLQGKSVWNREKNEFIRFATVLPSGKVYGLTRFSFREDKTLEWIQRAREATFDGDKWLLEDVTTTYLDIPIKEVHQKTFYWQTQFTPTMVSFMATEPENLTLRELRHYGDFLVEQQRDSRPYELEWWSKLMKPLEIFSLVIIAVSFVFGPLRQVTMGQRVFMGVMVGVVFQTLQNIFGTSSLVFGFSPLMAVLFPIMVCAAMGFVMLWRVH